MSDVLVVLGGGIIGLVLALVSRALRSLFGQTSRAFLIFAWYVLGPAIGLVGLLSCFALLGAHWGGPALTPTYNWQYTPHLVFATCLGVFFARLAFDWYRDGKPPARTASMLSRREQPSPRKWAAIGLFVALALVFAFVFLHNLKPYQCVRTDSGKESCSREQ